MHRLRPIIVALVALAVAALPMTGVSVAAAASEAPAVSGHADCCSFGQPCATKAMADHAKDQGQGHCGCKCLCLGLTAVLSGSTGALSPLMPLAKTTRLADNARSLTYIPPAPPPRV